MQIDLFGRGWPDIPKGTVAHGTRLYISQMLYVARFILSSLDQTRWVLHLFGCSFGGSLALSFAQYFPHPSGPLPCLLLQVWFTAGILIGGGGCSTYSADILPHTRLIMAREKGSLGNYSSQPDCYTLNR